VPSKRSRGTYARLICLRCRSRKIKCVLQDDDRLLQPSPNPLPHDKACQRCQQNGYECILDYTTLGRPAQKRTKTATAAGGGDDISSLTRDAQTASHVGDLTEIALVDTQSPSAEAFLLSHPIQEGDRSKSQVKDQVQLQPSNEELLEALMGPSRLLASLLAQDGSFGHSLPLPGPCPRGVDLLALVKHDLAVLLEKHLIWHRFYFPYFPSIVELRRQIAYSRPVALQLPATKLLFAALCSTALDVPSDQLDRFRHIQNDLLRVLFELGQEVLFTLPCHQHTVLALSCIAAYQPQSVIATRRAGSGAVIGKIYITPAKRIAKQLGLDEAYNDVYTSIASGETDSTKLQNAANACLEWARLCVIDADIYGGAKQPRRSFREVEPSASDSLDAVRFAIDTQPMSAEIVYAYVRLQAQVNEWESCNAVAANWRRLDALADVIADHGMTCELLLEACKAWSADIRSRGLPEHAYALLQLTEMQLFSCQKDVTGLSMFYAIMSSAHPPGEKEEIGPDDAVRISEHIIDRLKSHDSADPNRPPLRVFLEQFGDTRTEVLQRVITSFITACDFKIDGISHCLPPRVAASEMLFICKEVVEGNAARYKGWGGLDENTDMLLILFHSCARKLEESSAHAVGDSKKAIAEGNILAASAKLIRSLHQIMSGWK
ncbi:hypothetical protein K431DRAFT_212318, partial [Polychaeton citri CBS 116435]